MATLPVKAFADRIHRPIRGSLRPSTNAYPTRYALADKAATTGGASLGNCPTSGCPSWALANPGSSAVVDADQPLPLEQCLSSEIGEPLSE